MSTRTAETGSAVIETGTVEVTAETISTLVDTGGYTHPLFQRTDAGRPLPGQGLFLLMGGLVEQSGALDRTGMVLQRVHPAVSRVTRLAASNRAWRYKMHPDLQ